MFKYYRMRKSEKLCKPIREVKEDIILLDLALKQIEN